MSTKSLYNIAGFLGAQSRSNPADHGDSWDSHKSAKPQECTFNLERIDEHPKLIPIDPLTIKVGDTVKLIGDVGIGGGFGQDLTLGNYYNVVFVDPDDDEMPIQIADDVNDSIWMFAENMLQVI